MEYRFGPRYLRPLKTKEEYFKDWDKDNVDNLEGIKEDDGTAKSQKIFTDYVVRWKIFKRDNYRCQVEGCKFQDSYLTMHHFKHASNGGKTMVRNCVTVCRAHQNRYHRGEEALKFKDNPNLPPHIRGFTQALEEYVNGKQTDLNFILLENSRKVRKQNKHLWRGNNEWRRISFERIVMLFHWLFHMEGCPSQVEGA